MNRRKFLQTTAVLSGAYVLPGIANSIPPDLGLRLYSAVTNNERKMFVNAIDLNGKEQFRTELPARAHAISHRLDADELIVFARKPGQFIFVLDKESGEIKHKIEPEKNRLFYGHGAFSSDQHILFSTENDYERLKGVIGIYDATDSYKRIGEYASGGIGPHQLLSDQNKLVVANGGILTHPDSGSTKLNLDTMRSNLSYLDIDTGKVLDRYELNAEFRLMSIRHLDMSVNGQVCFGMQFQGADKNSLPLVGFHKGEATLQLATMPESDLARLKNYCGSVTTDQSGNYFAVTSPRGHQVSFWRADGQYLSSSTMVDVCGAAPSGVPNQFCLSSGLGNVVVHDISRNTRIHILDSSELRWDNHMILS